MSSQTGKTYFLSFGRFSNFQVKQQHIIFCPLVLLTSAQLLGRIQCHPFHGANGGLPVRVELFYSLSN